MLCTQYSEEKHEAALLKKGRREGEKHGIEISEKRGIAAMSKALQLLHHGATYSEIAEQTGLSYEDVEVIAEQTKSLFALAR